MQQVQHFTLICKHFIQSEASYSYANAFLYVYRIKNRKVYRDEWILMAIRAVSTRVYHPATRELKQERRADRRREVARPSSWSLDAARRPRARTRIDAARASAATHAPRPATGRLRSAPASITPETYQTNKSNRVVILCEIELRATADKCRC